MSYNEYVTMKQRTFLFLSLFFIAPFVLPNAVFAATLYLDPANENVGPGDTFLVTVRIDTETGECINAATIEINYPVDWMKASVLSKGESLLTLWPEEPTIDSERGRILFSGGIPAGYCGRVQGDPGKTNILGKIIFTIPGNMIGGKIARPEESLPITFGSSTKVLQNDGFGTPAPLTLRNAEFIRQLNPVGIKNEWLDIVHADTISPAAFEISVHRDANTLEGKYFIIFSTVDKQSGVHHYEVMEDDPLKLGFIRGKNQHAAFVTAVSPYILTDQSLKSRITVRAIDNAGNTEEAIAAPTNGVFAAKASSDTGALSARRVDALWILLALGALLCAGVALWYYRKKDRQQGIDQGGRADPSNGMN